MVAFLSAALFSACRAGAPLDMTLPMMEEIRKGVSKMKQVWEVSLYSLAGRDTDMRFWMRAEEKMRKSLEDGSATMETQMGVESTST